MAGKTVSFTLTVGKSIENVGSAKTNSSGVATLTGVNLAGYSAGTYSGVVRASFAGDTNDSSGSGSGGLQVKAASAQLHLSNLTLSYDGRAQFATLSTTPAGIGGVTVTYTQNKAVVAAPTKPGSYQVTASLNNANYTAQTITGTLVINPATPVIQWAAPRPSYPAPPWLGTTGCDGDLQQCTACGPVCLFAGGWNGLECRIEPDAHGSVHAHRHGRLHRSLGQCFDRRPPSAGDRHIDGLDDGHGRLG